MQCARVSRIRFYGSAGCRILDAQRDGESQNTCDAISGKLHLY